MNGFACSGDREAALSALTGWQRAAETVAHHLDRLADPCIPRGARRPTELADGWGAIADFAASVRWSIERDAEVDDDLANRLARLDSLR